MLQQLCLQSPCNHAPHTRSPGSTQAALSNTQVVDTSSYNGKLQPHRLHFSHFKMEHRLAGSVICDILKQ